MEDYQPHPGQKEFHDSKAKIRLCLASNQWGKSRAGTLETLSYCLGRRPWEGSFTKNPPVQCLVVGYDFTNAVSGILAPLILYYAPSDSIDSIEKLQNHVVSKINFKNGSFIKFGSHEQDPSKFEGTTWDLVWFDEPPPRDIWVATKRGLMARRGRAVFTMTPLSEPWIYEELFLNAGKDPEIWARCGSIYENPYIEKEEIERFVKSLSEEEIEARVHGRFRHLLGRVFREYDPDIHLLQRNSVVIHPKWPKVCVVDPHVRRAFMCIWAAITPEGDYIIFEEFPQGVELEAYKKNHSLDEYVEIFQRTESTIPGGHESVLYRFLDPNFGRSGNFLSGRSLEEELIARGLYFDTRVQDSLDEGHLAVRTRLLYDKTRPRDALNRPRLFVTNNCINVHKSFMGYTWDNWVGKTADRKGEKEKPRERYKDAMDCVRYLCVADPGFEEVGSNESAHDAYVERVRNSRVYL